MRVRYSTSAPSARPNSSASERSRTPKLRRLNRLVNQRCRNDGQDHREGSDGGKVVPVNTAVHGVVSASGGGNGARGRAVRAWLKIRDGYRNAGEPGSPKIRAVPHDAQQHPGQTSAMTYRLVQLA